MYLRNTVFLRLSVLALAFIMLNFSIYMAEVDVLQRVTTNKNLIECITDLIIQSPVEEEENGDSTTRVDLILSHVRHDHYANLFLLRTNLSLHPVDLAKSNPRDTETQPPEA